MYKPRRDIKYDWIYEKIVTNPIGNRVVSTAV